MKKAPRWSYLGVVGTLFTSQAIDFQNQSALTPCKCSPICSPATPLIPLFLGHACRFNAPSSCAANFRCAAVACPASGLFQP